MTEETQYFQNCLERIHSVLFSPMALCNTCLTDRHSEKSIIYMRYSQLLKTSLDSNSYLAEASLGEAMTTKENIWSESKMGHTHI